MKEDINIEELFQQKFENFEGNVSPDVWANISQSIGATTTTTVVTTGLSTFAKVAIVSGGIIVASVASVLIYNAVNTENKTESTDPASDNLTVIDEPNENIEESDKVFTLEVADEGDSVIENNKEEIAKAIQDNELEEMVVPEELVEEILYKAQDVSGSVMIFDMIGERGVNPQKENEVSSERDIVVPGTEKKEVKTNKEEKSTEKEDVVVHSMKENTNKEEEEIEEEKLLQPKVSVPNVFSPDGEKTSPFGLSK